MSWDYGFGGGKTSTFKRCYEDHPAMPVGEHFIYGGSCSSPIVTDADIYVGFDHSMKLGKQSYPWSKGDSFLYHITDMAAPANAKDFKRLIKYLADNLLQGKKVHIGCIGGHGRTGTALAALVQVMTGEANAINYVRKHYCKKAVESKSQINFLQKNFGITPVKPTKEYLTSTWGGTVKKAKGQAKVLSAGKSSHPIAPMDSGVDIWGWNYRE
jgi:hypothetical protein